MPQNEKRRQKKLEKKRVERKQRLVQAARVVSSGPAVRLAATSHWKFNEAFETPNDTGMSQLCFSRHGPDGSVVCVFFLIDRYFFGVKDVYMRVTDYESYSNVKSRIEHRLGGVRSVSPEYARKLIEGVERVAAGRNVKPHRDISTMMLIFGNVNSAACTEPIDDGSSHETLYIQGPNDDFSRLPGGGRSGINFAETGAILNISELVDSLEYDFHDEPVTKEPMAVV